MLYCSVDTLPSCSFNGQPFSGESVLASGICKEIDFFSLIPLSCAISYSTGDINSPTARAAWDVICTDICGERIANYLNETCFDLIGSTFTKVSCLQTEGTFGDHCHFSFFDVYNAQMIRAVLACQDFLSDNMTCPTTCGELIRSISEEAGCCFQSIYNSSVIYLFSDNVGADSDVIRDPLLWDTCEVPLVSACLDEPFRVTSSSTSTVTSTTRSEVEATSEMDGASMKLAGSTDISNFLFEYGGFHIWIIVTILQCFVALVYFYTSLKCLDCGLCYSRQFPIAHLQPADTCIYDSVVAIAIISS